MKNDPVVSPNGRSSCGLSCSFVPCHEKWFCPDVQIIIMAPYGSIWPFKSSQNIMISKSESIAIKFKSIKA